MKKSRQSVKFPCWTVWGIDEEESGRSALNADAARSVVGASVLPLPADHTGMSPASACPRRPSKPRIAHQQRDAGEYLPPRVIVVFVLLIASVVLAMGVKSVDTPEGWSSWVLVPALVMDALSVWLLRVESRDPWARRGGGRHEREE